MDLFCPWQLTVLSGWRFSRVRINKSASTLWTLKTDSAFDLHSLTKGKGWVEYIKGVAYQLQNAGYELRGFDAIMTGDVPNGAGLSSSAAVELATARAFAAVSGFSWDAA